MPVTLLDAVMKLFDCFFEAEVKRTEAFAEK